MRAIPDADTAATRSFYETRVGGAGPSSWAELREVRAARRVDPTVPGRTIEDIVESDVGGVPVRIILPRNGVVNGVHLHLHGGGFYMDCAARDDARSARRADALGVAVIGVDYRLAPESPWPAAPDDCEAVARWLIEVAQSRFGTRRLTIGGMSAGATLVVATLVRLRSRGLATRFPGAVLEAGSYDLSGQTPAGRVIEGEYFIEAYAGDAADRSDPDISPAFADLVGLPPTLVVIGADDIVLADNLAMAARLSAAANDVELLLYPEVPHGFTLHETPIGRTAVRDTDRWLAQIPNGGAA